MTVKELIELLKGYPEDYEVHDLVLTDYPKESVKYKESFIEVDDEEKRIYL